MVSGKTGTSIDFGSLQPRNSSNYVVKTNDSLYWTPLNLLRSKFAYCFVFIRFLGLTNHLLFQRMPRIRSRGQRTVTECTTLTKQHFWVISLRITFSSCLHSSRHRCLQVLLTARSSRSGRRWMAILLSLRCGSKATITATRDLDDSFEPQRQKKLVCWFIYAAESGSDVT